MPVRVLWDRYEVALLFDAYEHVVIGSDINTEAARLSQTLRDLAIRRNISIDDTYRNVNGMKMQLGNVQYLFTNGEKGLSGASSMIRQMYEVYNTNPKDYQTILKEAIRMTENTTMSVEDAFFTYAKGRTSLSPKILAEYLQKAVDYCQLKQPLLGMTDVKAVRNVQQKVAEGKLLQFRFGKDAQAIRNVTQLYYTFIKSYRKPKTRDANGPAAINDAEEEWIIHELRVRNIPFADNRGDDDCLWIASDMSISISLNEAADRGYHLQLKQDGCRAFPDRPVLWTKDQPPKSINTSGFRRKLDENFKPYLLTVKKLALPTATQYSQSIEAVERFILERKLGNSLDTTDPDEVQRIYAMLQDNDDFVDWNKLRHHQYSAALMQYVGYLRRDDAEVEDSDNCNEMTIKDVVIKVLRENDTALTVPEIMHQIEAEHLYRFNSSNPMQILHQSIRRYCKDLEVTDHSSVDVFERFIDEKGQIRYKLIGEEIKSTDDSENEENTNADERWLPILKTSFPDGYILNDFLGQFQAAVFWQEYYGDECPIHGDAIDAAMKAVGVVKDGRVFIKSEEDKQLIVTICTEINDILSRYTTVYRSCIYDRYHEQLASISIYTEQVMTQQLLEEAKGSFYSVNQMFSKSGQYTSIIQDARKVLRDHGGPMSVDDVAKVLWFIPRDLVYHNLSVDDESINIGNGTWMLAEHFPVTHEDAVNIGIMLDEYFLANSYVQAFDLVPLLRNHLPSIADNLSGMTYQAIFHIVQYYLRDRFSFTKAIISPKGTSVDFTGLFRTFAAEHETFTLADLEGLASELKLPIYWESTYAGGAVRISKTEFVNRKCIQFDVETTDAVLADFCPGDYLPLMSVSSAMMIHLPSCGYRWNGFLLQSYVHGFSKKFRLSYSSFGKSGYYGAMVRRSCKTINNYGSLVERILTDDDTWETTDDALDILVKYGYQAQRKYKGIDTLCVQAKRNKLPDDER